MPDEAPKKKFATRTLDYAKKRMLLGNIGTFAGQGFSALKGTFEIRKISRAQAREGFEGRYEDGGREKFARMVLKNGLTADDIDLLAKRRAQSAQLFWCFGVFLLAVSAYTWSTGDGGLLNIGSGFAIFLIAIVLGLTGFVQDFISWQLRLRRFGGIREYLKK